MTLADRTGALDDAVAALDPFAERLSIAAGRPIFAEGAASDAFFLIDEGEVRIEVHGTQVDTDNVLAFSGPGSFLGEIGVLAGTPRSATAVAHTDVRLRRYPAGSVERLAGTDARAATAVALALGRDAAAKLLASSQRVAEYLADQRSDPDVDRQVAAAVDAQRRFASWSEREVDTLLGEVAAAVAGHAEALAATALAETGIGNVADKAIKIRFASLGVFASLAGKPGHGPVGRRRDPLRDQRLPLPTAAAAVYHLLRARPDAWRRLPRLVARPGSRVTEQLRPVGVVFAMVPLTEPVGTFIDNVLIALKGRNAIILSPHRLAQGVTDATGELVRQALIARGAPPLLVQWVGGRTSRQTTARFMRHPDVALVLATGGASMVKAAYSSGKPALGVGPGNAPAWIAADADLAAAAYGIVESKSFDYGLVCGAEQHLVVDRSVVDGMRAALEAAGAFLLDAGPSEQFVARAFDPVTTDLRIELVGHSPAHIATAVGLDVPSATRLLVFRADPAHPEGAAARERLAPVVSLFEVDGEHEAIDLCRRILAYEGAGHTAVVHTTDRARAARFADAVPVSRVLVNTPATHGCCGLMTGLSPSLTLGCGTYGGNSTTDNVTFTHLVNVQRTARVEYTNPALLSTFDPRLLADKLMEQP